MFKKLIIFLLIISFLTTSALGIWIVRSENFLENNYVTLSLNIEKGESYRKTYNKIFRHLNTPFMFDVYLKYVYDFAKSRKFGHYKSDNLPLKQLLSNITEGRQHTVKVTIPEGFNIYDIAKELSKHKIVNYEAFIDKATDDGFVYETTGRNRESLEGFLYPDTYFLPKNAKISDITKLMYKNFQKNVPENFLKKLADEELNFYEGLILSSIIQKETFSNEESRVVASVFLNRLEKGMRLQSDPTTIYGIYSKFNGNLKKKHLKNEKNIYNTYRHSGLPPTPICNPSKTAMSGLANHAETEYLYFVSDSEGKHIFSKTYRKHRRNVNKYQK